jgi:DNA-binding CsgD family transcriptional regulator
MVEGSRADAGPWSGRPSLDIRVAEGERSGLSRVNEVIAQVATTASPSELIDLAPMLLCRAGRYDRALISRVSGSTWRPHSIHVMVGAEDPVNTRLYAQIPTVRVPLTSHLVETTVLRRRAAMLVDADSANGHTVPVFAELSRSRAYVVAPIVVTDRAVGFLHADCRTSRRELTAVDKTLIATFADLFGLLYERAVTARHLRDQRHALRAALDHATDKLTGMTVERLDRARPAGAAAAKYAGGPMSSGGLTEREWEILGLLATGATNTQIAATLVVSEGTVKSHVKRILRKLPAANRAEAVYRYTCLVQGGSRAS